MAQLVSRRRAPLSLRPPQSYSGFRASGHIFCYKSWHIVCCSSCIKNFREPSSVRLFKIFSCTGQVFHCMCMLLLTAELLSFDNCIVQYQPTSVNMHFFGNRFTVTEIWQCRMSFLSSVSTTISSLLWIHMVGMNMDNSLSFQTPILKQQNALFTTLLLSSTLDKLIPPSVFSV